MSDPLTSKKNIKDSVKKYFIEEVEAGAGVPITFDGTVDEPPRDGADKWVIVSFGQIYTSGNSFSTALVNVYLCAREDNEGNKLAILHDILNNCLTNSAGNNGVKRIPFYQSDPVLPWVQIGVLLVDDINVSDEQMAPDKTKFEIMIVRLKFATI